MLTGYSVPRHQYFESTLVARECEEDMSLAESRIKASAKFFGPSCKAGPWVADPVEDKVLSELRNFLRSTGKKLITLYSLLSLSIEAKYPSLCAICYNPFHCGIGDKHWGRRGPLNCLTSGLGDIAWVRLDDVRSHFGVSSMSSQLRKAN